MPHSGSPLNRRAFLSTTLGAAAALSVRPLHAQSAQPGPILTRAVPTSGERLPAIGMGSWITFDVGSSRTKRAQRVEVLDTFFRLGGRLIDSSPMYGSSEAVIGYCLRNLGNTGNLFAATKVWTLMQAMGERQMAASRGLWGVERFDLMQIHNMLDWESHLETLLADKAAGRIRYIGITTSHGRRHDAMAKVIAQVKAEQPFDFVQFTYNILDREAEQRLLPLAAERRLAVIINRPFRRGALFDLFQRHPLPPWAAELGIANWAQFFLKFITSHPAVTCAIPATSRPDHMAQNMGALHGPQPDPQTRRRMIAYVEGL